MARSSNTLRKVLAVAASFAVAVSTLVAVSGSASAVQPSKDAPGVAAAKKIVAFSSTIPTKINITVPLSRRPPTGLKVFFVSSNNSSTQQLYVGFQAAAKALGWSATSLFYQSNPAEANGLIQQAIQQGATYIMVNGVDATVIPAGLNAARSANVPVFLSQANGVPAGKVNWIFANPNSTNEYAYRGVTTAAATVANSNGKANVLLFNVPVFSVFQVWAQVYKENLPKFCPPPNCVFNGELDVPLADVLSGKSTSSIVAYLRSHPEVNQIACSNAAWCVDVPRAAAAAGITVNTNGIGMSATAMTAAALPYIVNGGFQSSVATPLEYVAWQVADAMARQSVGDSLLPNWKARVPLYMFTTANTHANTQMYAGPTNYTGQFKKLWHR